MNGAEIRAAAEAASIASKEPWSCGSERPVAHCRKVLYDHLVAKGFAIEYRVMRREPLEGFGKTLPTFAYRGELVYPSKGHEQAAYEYAKQDAEPVRSLHRAMNSKVNRGADFFLETCIARGSYV